METPPPGDSRSTMPPHATPRSDDEGPATARAIHVVWLIPDYYSFLVDGFLELGKRIDRLTVMCPKPAPEAVARQTPSISFVECPPRVFPFTRGVLAATARCVTRHGIRRCLRNHRHLRDIAAIARRLPSVARSREPTVLHSHFAFPGGLGGSIGAPLPHVVSLRGYDILTTGDYGALWNPFWRANITSTFRNGTPVIVGSSFTAEAARRILGPDVRLSVLTEGIDVDSFSAAGRHTRESLGLQADDNVLLMASNLVPVKNVAMLLRSLPEIRRSVPRLKVLICGDGPLREQLTKISEHDVASSVVRFLGRLPRGELCDLYSLSNVFVHCALSEGFCNVLLEAMAHGLFVVTSKVGAATDVIRDGENGLLYTTGCPISLQRAVVRAFERLPQMGPALSANVAYVRKHHSIARCVSGYLSAYHMALATSYRGAVSSDRTS